jgi:hypothetical protein
MPDWELHDGKEQIGPLDEDHVLRMIAGGLPETTVVRPVGSQKWKSLRAHAPFAIALERAAATTPAPAQQQPAQQQPAQRQDAFPAFLARYWKGIFAVVAMLFSCGMLKWACGPRTLTHEDYANVAPPPAPAPVPVPEPPLPNLPTSVPKGTWAKIPMPGTDIPDTPANAAWYVKHLGIVPGEPALNVKVATGLLLRVRAEMAKQGTIPLAAITVAAGDGIGAITVAKGTFAKFLVHGEPRQFGACNELLFAGAQLAAGVSHEDFAKVGVRAVVCNSDDCAAAMDMRPTAPGGGVYAGESCPRMDEMIKMDIAGK